MHSDQPHSRGLATWHWGWWVALVLVLFVRVHECRLPPRDSTDVYRHLGYSAHLEQRGYDLYNTRPDQTFRHEYWTHFWGEQCYIYPPATLSFFAGFSALKAGMFWTKLTLTLADLGTALILGALLGPVAALLAFAAPESIWYVSHEGQFESLLGFSLALTVLFLRRRSWLLGGIAFMVALQLKQFAVLLAPWLLYELLALDSGHRLRATLHFGLGLLIGFAPFAGFYMKTPNLWWRPLQTQARLYNPYAWKVWNPEPFYWNPKPLYLWNAVWSYAATLISVTFGLQLLFQRRLRELLAAGPIIGFWFLLKSLRWAQFWYLAIVPGLTATLYRHRRWAVAILSCHLLLGARGALLLVGCDFGYLERPAVVSRLSRCMYRCDYRAR